jgi:hypothetical protein
MPPAVDASYLVENGIVLAQLTATSGTALRDIALGIIGTLALIVLAARFLGALADEQYGKMITAFLASVPVFGFSYFPDITVSIIVGVFTAFFG